MIKKPLPHPWPTDTDLQAAVVESLRDRPGEWRLKFNIWGWRFLDHRRTGITVDPDGTVCGPYSMSWKCDQALFHAHPEVLADIQATREKHARRIHTVLSKLRGT